MIHHTHQCPLLHGLTKQVVHTYVRTYVVIYVHTYVCIVGKIHLETSQSEILIQYLRTYSMYVHVPTYYVCILVQFVSEVQEGLYGLHFMSILMTTQSKKAGVVSGYAHLITSGD